MKPFTVIVIVIFALGAVMHLVRYFMGWEIMISSYTIPLWVSLPAFVIAGGLAIMLWREMK